MQKELKALKELEALKQSELAKAAEKTEKMRQLCESLRDQVEIEPQYWES